MNYGSEMRADEFKTWLQMYVDCFASLVTPTISLKRLLSVISVEQYAILLSRWSSLSTSLKGVGYLRCLNVILTEFKGGRIQHLIDSYLENRRIIRKNLYKIVNIVVPYCSNGDTLEIIASLNITTDLLLSNPGRLRKPDILVIILGSLTTTYKTTTVFKHVSTLLITLLKYHREHVGSVMHLIVSLLQDWMPIILVNKSKSINDASHFSRILETLSHKPANEDTDVLVDFSMRPFAKHLVHLVAQFILFNPSANIEKTLVIKDGIYVLLDILNDHERKYLLDHIGYTKKNKIGRDMARQLVKELYITWNKTHKFTGKV